MARGEAGKGEGVTVGVAAVAGEKAGVEVVAGNGVGVGVGVDFGALATGGASGIAVAATASGACGAHAASAISAKAASGRYGFRMWLTTLGEASVGKQTKRDRGVVAESQLQFALDAGSWDLEEQ